MISEVKVRQEILLGIVDHYKRNKVQKLFQTDTVVGAIQGRVSGNGVYLEKMFEVPWRGDSNHLDEDFLGAKLELEKQVNPELDLVGYYVTSTSLEPSGQTEELLKTFQKKSELLFVVIFDPTVRTTKDTGIPLKIYEPVTHERKFKQSSFTLVADASEVICMNDLLRHMSEGAGTDSGYVRGMKSWQNSFGNYIEKLQKIEKRLVSGSPLSPEELRQIKEIVVNFPSNFAEDNSGTLEEKFVTANLMNLLTSVFKCSQTQDTLGALTLKGKKEDERLIK